MNAAMFRAFGDELEKIAVLKTLGKFIRSGWEVAPGITHHPSTPKWLHGWVGAGAQPSVTRAGNIWEQATSLGGLTRYLPVGPKSLMVAGTAPLVADAMRREDPQGQDRSRAERMAGVAGETLGGLMGSGMATHLAPKSGLIAPMLGFAGGSMLGKRVATLPFNLRRRQQPAQPEPPPPGPEQSHDPQALPVPQSSGVA